MNLIMEFYKSASTETRTEMEKVVLGPESYKHKRSRMCYILFFNKELERFTNTELRELINYIKENNEK